MVGPVALRLAAVELEAKYAMKKRRACRVVGLAPATYYYRTQRPEMADVRARLLKLPPSVPAGATDAFTSCCSARGIA